MKVIFPLFFIFYSPLVHCQFNDTTHYFAQARATGIINKTNDGRSYVLSNNLRFSVSKKNISANAAAGLVYGKQQNELINRDFTASLDFNLLETFRHFYYWGLATYERSFSLKINHRGQTGLGIGYNIVDRKHAWVVVSDGILYEKSDLVDNAEVANSEYETFRNSFRLKVRYSFLDEAVTLEGTSFLQHALRDRKDYIIRSNASFSMKLIRWLSFTAGVTYNKLSVTRRENLLINFGFTAERYF